MTRSMKRAAIVPVAVAFSFVLFSTSLAFAQGEAADTQCNPYYAQCPCGQVPNKNGSNPKCVAPQSGMKGNTANCSPGICTDPVSGQAGTCVAAGLCKASNPKGQPTQAQKDNIVGANQSSAGSSGSSDSGAGSSGSSGGSSPGASSGTSNAAPQLTGTPPMTEPEVLSPSETAQALGSTPTTDTTAGSAAQTSQPAQSAETTLNDLIGQMTPDQTVSQMFMQPGESAAPTQATDLSQPSWLGAEASLQPSGAPPGGLSGAEGTSPTVPTSEPPLSTYEPSSLPFTETNPMGSLNDLNSADIQAANTNVLETPSEQAAQSAAEATQNAAETAQNAQNLNAVENGASTFGQSAADYLNNGSETNGQFPTNSPDGNAYLADQRANLMSPLDPSSPNYDPNLRTEVEAVINNEVNPSTYTQQSADAVLERMANASLMYGYTSLSQAINNGFYGPVNTGAVANMVANGMTPAQTAFADQAISDVTGGSNVCNYCTDQGMASEIHGPSQNIGGEYFGYMNGSQTWSNAEAAQAQVYNASYASQEASALPSQAQTVPYSWAGDISSAASLGSSAPINESALATPVDSANSWSGQTASTIDWTNVAATYGSPSPTVGEDIASAAEPSGEPTTDQLGNQTEAGIWGDQQQNIVDEQLAVEDREAEAVAETDAYNGALAAQNGLSETGGAIASAVTSSGLDDGLSANGEAIANATTPSGLDETQSPALTSSLGPSQSDIEQAYANAFANSPDSLQEVDAVKGDFAPNPVLSEGPGGIGSDYASSEGNSPTTPSQIVADVMGQTEPLSSGPGGIGSDFAASQPTAALSEGSGGIGSDFASSNSTLSSGSGGIGSDFASNNTVLSAGSGGIGSDVASDNSILSSGQGGVGSDLASSQPSAPLSEGAGGVGSDLVSSQPTAPFSSGAGGIGSDFASNNSILSSGSGGVGSDFVSSNSQPSSGAGIGSDYASSQNAAPASPDYGQALAESATQNANLEEQETEAEITAGSDINSAENAQEAQDQQQLLDREAQATEDSAAYVNSFEYALSPMSIAENPALTPQEIAQSFTSANAGITDAEAFSGPTELAPDLTDVTAPIEPVTTEPLPLSQSIGGIGSDFASNNSILSSDSGGIGSDLASNNSVLSSGSGGIGSDFASNNSIPSSGQGGIGSDFASNNAQLSSGSGGIGSDEASSKSSSPNIQETPQTPQFPQTPTSPEQNPAIENPPLPTARPTTPTNPSIVDFLNSAGVDASYASRAALAAMNGIDNYVGSAAQNLKLLQICFAGNCFK